MGRSRKAKRLELVLSSVDDVLAQLTDDGTQLKYRRAGGGGGGARSGRTLGLSRRRLTQKERNGARNGGDVHAQPVVQVDLGCGCRAGGGGAAAVQEPQSTRVRRGSEPGHDGEHADGMGWGERMRIARYDGFSVCSLQSCSIRNDGARALAVTLPECTALQTLKFVRARLSLANASRHT